MAGSQNSIELQRFQHQISQTRSFQNLITMIQLKILYNLEQVCQNFSLTLLDIMKHKSVRHLGCTFKIIKVAKVKVSVQ